jgi:acetamidase/formamidase
MIYKFCLLVFVLIFPLLLPAQGKRHVFTPTAYYKIFNATTAPVLRISSGDTVVTESVDAGGFDKYGKRVTEKGNPLTGPFFIEDAMPGDVLVIKLIDVRLNRDYATTLNTLIPKIFPGAATKKAWREAKLVRWHLDTVSGFASPVDTSEGLNRVKVPLHPFIGCIGVAPEGSKTFDSGASEAHGGNLDCRFITTGSSLYLPVSHEGAYLLLGDAHAAQGDGELNGDALETSMIFAFTVSVIKKGEMNLSMPAVETDDYWMFFGIESSLDKSMVKATEYMVEWLQHRYGLSRMAASQIVGPAVEYRIPKVAASKVEVVAMISKAILIRLL